MSLGASLRARSDSPLLRDSVGDNSSASVPASSSSRQPHSDPSCPLFNALAARKRAEQDSILLANRIRLLKAEDDKTRKKIRETEKKTQDLINMQRRNEEQRAAREAEAARRDAEEQELRAAFFGQREEQQHKIEQKQRMVLQQNALSSNNVRNEREEGLRRIQQEREADLANQFAKAEKVRKLAGNASKMRARSEDAKQDLARHVHQERLSREEDAKNERLKEVAKMEREEQALLAKLQHSQERHRAAFLQLEDVMKQRGGQLAAPSDHQATAGISGSMAALAAASSAAAAVCGARRPPRPPAQSAGYNTTMASNISSRPASLSLSDGASRGGSARATPQNSRRPRRTSSDVGGASSMIALKVVKQSSPPGSGSRGQEAERYSSGAAVSSCSTASGGNSGAAGSGQSTPCSVSITMPPGPTVSYTTVDGAHLEIPTEDDLDLASLLNS